MTGNATINSGGRVTLNAANALTGNATVATGGVLAYGINSGLTGNLIFDGGSLEAVGGTRTISDTITINSVGMGFTGSENIIVSSAIDLSADSIFTADNGSTATISGIIDDMGGMRVFTKEGGGTIELQGMNTYSGGTVINDGTLVIGTGGQILNNVTVDGGALDINNNDGVTGNATINSGGRVILNAANALTGNATVNTGGTVAFGTDDGLMGNLIFNGGTLEAVGGARMISDNITLIDDLSISGSENITIVSAIALTADRIFDVSNSASSIISGILSGTGDFIKNGSGTLDLQAANTYTGTTTINNGRLIVTGSVVSDVFVNGASAELAGTGTFMGDVTVTQGDISPGDFGSIGTMNVTGDLVLATQSELRIDLALDSASADRLIVGGTFTRGGEVVVNLPSVSGLLNGTSIVVAEADIIDGAFDNQIVEPFAAFDFTLDLTADVNGANTTDELRLIVETVPYTITAATGNQASVANALETIRVAPTGDETTVINALNILNTAQLRSAMDQIVPEEIGAMPAVALSSSSAQAGNVDSRLAEVRQGVRGHSARNLQLANLSNDPQDDLTMLALASQASEPWRSDSWRSDTWSSDYGDQRWSPNQPWNFFAAGAGTFGEVDSTKEQAGYDFQTGEITFGVDRRLDPYTIAGATIGYANSQVDIDSSGGDTDVNSVKFGVYGTFHNNGIYVNGMIGGGYHMYDTDRRIQFGTINRTASSSPDGIEFNAMLSIGFDVDFKDWVIQPIGSVRYAAITIEDYSESGAQSLNLDVDRQTVDSFLLEVGIRASTSFQYLDYRVIPELRVSLQHEAEDQGPSGSARFASGGSFSFETTDLGDNGLVLGAGVTILLDNQTSYFIDLQSDIGERDYIAHSVRAGIRVPF